jgi:hypothetical protein
MSWSIDDATENQKVAYTKGYADATENKLASIGGLYRGEELWYMRGYNARLKDVGGKEMAIPATFYIWAGETEEPNSPESITDLATSASAAFADYKNDHYPEEVRTVSETGAMKGVKPARHSLIPVEALDVMARLYGFGATKYADHNWRKGYEWSKSFDSMIRHANAFWAGEDIDKETNLPHLASVAWHAFTLMIFMTEHPELDDRYAVKEISEFGDRPEKTENPEFDFWVVETRKLYNSVWDTVGFYDTEEKAIEGLNKLRLVSDADFIRVSGRHFSS